MSLLERIELSRERIGALQSLKQRAEQAAEFEQRAKTLAGLASELDPLCAPAAVLHQAGIAIPQLDGDLLAALRSRAVRLKEGYAQDRSSILIPFPDEDFRFVFLTPCATFKRKTEAALADAWSGWVHGKTPAIDHEVLRVLSGVGALSVAVTRIQALLGLLGRYAAGLPKSADDVKQVTALCSQVDLAWYELAGDGIAPDVLTFLRSAGSGIGASYEQLTPSILEWLDEHNLRRVLRVRLG